MDDQVIPMQACKLLQAGQWSARPVQDTNGSKLPSAAEAEAAVVKLQRLIQLKQAGNEYATRP